MFNNKIYLDTSTAENKLSVLKLLLAGQDGIIDDLSIRVPVGENREKGVELKDITPIKLEKMIDATTVFEIYDDTPVFMLSYIEEYFCKNFILQNESYFILNPSSSWTIKGDIFSEKLAIEAFDHIM